jgi:hypothetical protein
MKIVPIVIDPVHPIVDPPERTALMRPSSGRAQMTYMNEKNIPLLVRRSYHATPATNHMVIKMKNVNKYDTNPPKESTRGGGGLLFVVVSGSETGRILSVTSALLIMYYVVNTTFACPFVTFTKL